MARSYQSSGDYLVDPFENSHKIRTSPLDDEAAIERGFAVFAQRRASFMYLPLGQTLERDFCAHVLQPFFSCWQSFESANGNAKQGPQNNFYRHKFPGFYGKLIEMFGRNAQEAMEFVSKYGGFYNSGLPDDPYVKREANIRFNALAKPMIEAAEFPGAAQRRAARAAALQITSAGPVSDQPAAAADITDVLRLDDFRKPARRDLPLG